MYAYEWFFIASVSWTFIELRITEFVALNFVGLFYFIFFEETWLIPRGNKKWVAVPGRRRNDGTPYFEAE